MIGVMKRVLSNEAWMFIAGSISSKRDASFEPFGPDRNNVWDGGENGHL